MCVGNDFDREGFRTLPDKVFLGKLAGLVGGSVVNTGPPEASSRYSLPCYYIH